MNVRVAYILYFALIVGSGVAVAAYSVDSSELLVPIAIIVGCVIPEEYLRTRFLGNGMRLGVIGLAVWLPVYVVTTLILSA